jgi:AcrR family transcriptional regulator
MNPVAEDVSGRRVWEAQRELVRNVQRGWVISAMARIVAESGPEVVSVREIVERAGVSRRRFYELFANCDDCFRAAFEEAIVRGAEQASIGYETEGEWVERMRAGLLGLLVFFDSEPELTRLSVLYTTPPRPTRARRNEVLTELAEFIDAGGRAARTEMDPPPLTAEAIVAGVLGVIQMRLLQSRPEPLTALLNPLMSVIVLPYLGTAAAQRELCKPVPEPSAPPPASPRASRPSVGLDIRLTYRTLSVLAEIAAAPGSSNQAVADAAGVRDQGQISKLLARLERLELIRNTGAGQPNGSANAWVLTPRGAEIGRAIKPRWNGGAPSPHPPSRGD